MPTGQYALYAILGVALAISVVTDLRSRRILNAVTYPTLALVLVLRFTLGGIGEAMDSLGLLSGLLGAVIAAGSFGLLNLVVRNGIGMGDIKLLAAMGAAVGFPTALACMIFTALSGALLSIAVLLWQGELLQTAAEMLRTLLRKLRIAPRAAQAGEKKYIPYGVAIAAGTVWGVIWQLSSPRI